MKEKKEEYFYCHQQLLCQKISKTCYLQNFSDTGRVCQFSQVVT